MTAIRAHKLSKCYGELQALSDLSLEIPEGGVCGFLGPNGAGKTTAVKLFSGLLSPTRGECEVMGLSPTQNPQELHRICGVMTESARMYGQLTGLENLLFFGAAAGISPQKSQERACSLLRSLGLWQERNQKASAYSTGMMQRLSLARALMHRPKVLFLDEPTSGLDPESAQLVNDLITFLAREEGTTVFLCTHQLRYAQDICSMYALIDRGKLLTCCNFEELWKQADCHIWAGFRLKDRNQPIEGFEEDNGWWKKTVADENEMPALVQKLVQNGQEIYEARLFYPQLEEVYFRYFQKSISKQGGAAE